MKQFLLLIWLFCTANIFAVNASFKDLTPKDTLLRIEANPAAGFNFPYYLFIPQGTPIQQSLYLMIETNNAGVNDSIDYQDRHARVQAQKHSLGNSIVRELKIPFLVPVFPRSETNWTVYTHALDRDAILMDTGDAQRLDLQLIAMIENAKSVLASMEIPVKEKVLFNGFSASGTFANRFTIIHPEKVGAVAVGGINGIPILPVKSIKKVSLDYPLGINDYKKVFGKHFNLKNYNALPQFLYMGAKDDNDAVQFDDAYSDVEREKVNKVIGKTMMPDRWDNTRDIYESVGVNAIFKTYNHIGHGTDEKIHADIIEFFTKVIQQ